MLEQIKESIDFIKTHTGMVPEAGIVLGTGLGGLVREIVTECEIPYSSIPHFPVSTVEGHKGQLIFGTLGGKPIVAMQGRFHYYEGYSMQELTFPIRVMKLLGIKMLIVSNASGGLNPGFEVGDIMFITDHINLMGDNPLIGRNHTGLGPRFPDMSEAYDRRILDLAADIASRAGVPFRTGVYAAVTGPTFETPAEYRYIHILGADAVGMSTVPEVIVARHMDLPVFAVSVISDLGVPGKIVEVSHQIVIDAASKAEPRMTRIISDLLKEISF
ncbi:Purine nucleoside phosphorylase 1 [bioreactor metagenome]|jgi:purine-nucleoside phosphorylase|uniref:purine-nucleoside phosphorylase n=1 Tax=bioreactor metagenome TaxID=1076179 RepID=A0A644UA51_9ZZZZ|nr:purine-nucleoside phosphorylase [Lentimicrobium sp.]MEA5110725.1 purine-nucleoside phosphorylase [Lentimicrobium sp.]HCT72273.1 purine-nucleoside phosphorylase [Bacteroidales bacterium]